MSTHLEFREKSGGNFDEKVIEKSGEFMKNCQRQGKMKLFAIVLGNVDTACYISIFYLKDKSYQYFFLVYADKLESGKSLENENLKIMPTLYNTRSRVVNMCTESNFELERG